MGALAAWMGLVGDTWLVSDGLRRSVVPGVEIPDDVDALGTDKASGVVELPHSIRWSAPRRQYDLSDRHDRARVYEQVLREGTAADVRFFIDVDALIDLWPDLYLPPHVHNAWAAWLRRRRGVRV